MSDSSIYNSILNNTNSMNYLVDNTDLVLELKEVDNYSSILVPKLLATNMYTNIQKYNYGLPFYLYYNGIYDSQLFLLDTYHTAIYPNLTSSFSFNNENNLLKFVAIEYPNTCYKDKAGSNIALDTTKYHNMKINIPFLDTGPYTTTFNTTFKISLYTSRESVDSVRDVMVTETGVKVANLEDINGSYYPYIYLWQCFDCRDLNNTQIPNTITMHISEWWFE